MPKSEMPRKWLIPLLTSLSMCSIFVAAYAIPEGRPDTEAVIVLLLSSYVCVYAGQALYKANRQQLASAWFLNKESPLYRIVWIGLIVLIAVLVLSQLGTAHTHSAF